MDSGAGFWLMKNHPPSMEIGLTFSAGNFRTLEWATASLRTQFCRDSLRPFVASVCGSLASCCMAVDWTRRAASRWMWYRCSSQLISYGMRVVTRCTRIVAGINQCIEVPHRFFSAPPHLGCGISSTLFGARISDGHSIFKSLSFGSCDFGQSHLTCSTLCHGQCSLDLKALLWRRSLTRNLSVWECVVGSSDEWLHHQSTTCVRIQYSPRKLGMAT